jgi:hypothetical protein
MTFKNHDNRTPSIILPHKHRVEEEYVIFDILEIVQANERTCFGWCKSSKLLRVTMKRMHLFFYTSVERHIIMRDSSRKEMAK